MIESFDRLYAIVFFGVALTLLALERVPALRRQPAGAGARWTSNVSLWALGNLVAAVVLPLGIYVFAQQRPPGALAALGLPLAVEILLTFVLLDAWKYAEHRVLHAVPLFWRAHLVHHSDAEIDVTTSERHHPLEALLATAVLAALVAALGLPAAGLALYLLTATVVALWSHANLRLPERVDRALRAVVVTPAVHAIHHSSLRAQTDSNFGEVLTVWDRAFGTYVDPARSVIRRFGLDAFPRPADARLDRVLLQPFTFRADGTSAVNATVDATAPAVASPVARDARADVPRAPWPRDARNAAVAGAAGVALLILAMWPALGEMVAAWTTHESSQYAWLVVPMVVYVLGWHDERALDPRPDWSGIVVVAIAALGWCAASLMNIAVGRQLAFVLALQGVAMSTLGWRAYRQRLPAFALLFLMIPAGDLLVAPLRALTLASLQATAWAAGLPHAADGFVFSVGTHRYIVVNECAGLPYVTLGAFLGYAFGLLLYRSWPKIVAMALLGAGLGVASNVLRVNAIVLVDRITGSQMDLTAHGAFQWIALFVALGLLFAVFARLDADPQPRADASSPARRRGSPARRFAPVATGLVGLLIAGGAAGWRAVEAAPARAMHAPIALPDAIAQWRRDGAAPAWSVDAQAQSLRATYVRERDGRRLDVVVVETLSPDANPSESALLPDDREAWRDKRADRTLACAGEACVALRHMTWERARTRELRDAYFAYALGDVVTDSRLALRAAHGWSRLKGIDAPSRLVAVVTDGTPLDPGDAAAAFLGVSGALAASESRR